MGTNNDGRKRRPVVIGGMLLVGLLMAMPVDARAQDAPIVGQIRAETATTAMPGNNPSLPTVTKPPGLEINRPTPITLSPQAGPSARPTSPSGTGSALSLYVQLASINETLYGGFPPDGDIATSPLFTVQIVNFGIFMINLNTGALARNVNFATFFGDSTDFLFDPRIIYDPVWQRFVIMVDGCNPCTGPSLTSFFLLAVSQTSDPTGGYFIYGFGVGTGPGDFADFPQMGMDLNSIIFTYNDYLANGNFDARTFALAKAYLYNGLGVGAPLFGGSGCTVAPPYVLDNGGPSYTLAACPNDNGVYLGPMSNTGLSNVSLQHWQAKVPVPSYTVPPCAPQPGVNYCLETTLDNRFENRSAQIGNRIWNVNVVTVGTATPRWYEFNTATNTLVSQNIWFASGTSSDWHPSINVNAVGATGSSPTGETFGTWMSVDQTNNLNLQLHAIGGAFDNAGNGAGIAVGPASAQPLTNQTFEGRNRAGDYSYISLLPVPVGPCQANEFAFLEGEVSLGVNWGTRLGVVKHC